MSDTASPSMHAPNPMQSAPFPVLVLDVRNGVSNPPRLGFKKMHWHADLQFIIVTEGEARIDCAGRHFTCTQGQGALFNSEVPHRIVGSEGSTYMSFIFPVKMLGFFPGSEMMTFGVRPFVGAHAQPVMHFDLSESWHAAVLDQLVHARNILIREDATGVDRYRACTHLIRSWLFYIENVDQKIPTRTEQVANDRIKAFTEFVDEHYADDVSLEDIAAAGNVSKAECSRCFKRMLQTTPYAYLMKYRIDKATELMREGSFSATSIAHMVGFGSASHFSTAFKKAIGYTPSQYMAAIERKGDA